MICYLEEKDNKFKVLHGCNWRTWCSDKWSEWDVDRQAVRRRKGHETRTDPRAAWEGRSVSVRALRYATFPFLTRSFPHPPLVTPPSSLGFRSRGGCDRRELTTRGTGHDRGTRTVIHSASRLIHSRSNPRILPPVPHVSISSHSHLLLFAPLRYATSLRTEDESVTRIRREDATWGV